MSLSQEQSSYNEKELRESANLLAAFYQDQALKNDLFNRILPLVIKKINAAQLFIHLESEAIKLRQLMADALFQEQRIFEQQLDAFIAEYLKNYAELDVVSSKKLKTFTADNQPRGIARSLMDLGAVAPNTLGDDFDIRMTLRHVITIAEDVRDSGIYILPPVLLVPGPNPNQFEKDNPHHALQDHVDTVLKNNPDKNITLLVQVNCGGSHWQAVKITLQNNKVQNAVLRDSLSTPPEQMREMPAFKNLQRAVRVVEVTPVAAGVQHDGENCMQYSMQYVLQEKYPAGVAIDPALQKIRDAGSAQELSTSVTEKIIANSPGIQEKIAQSDSGIKEFFQTPIAAHGKNLEQQVFMSLANSVGHKDKKAREIKDYQISFDEMLARELDQLYRSSSKQSDDELFAQARQNAYQQMQAGLRFFKPVANHAATVVSEPEVLKI